MTLSRNRGPKFRIVAFFTLSFLLFVIYTTETISQVAASNTTRIGIRKAAYPVENFCRVFGKALAQISNSEAEFPAVTSQYTDRFAGLRKDQIDIECGPNSRESGDIEYQPGKKFSDEIAFSGEDFYTTGTKLLLKESLAEDLTKLGQEAFTERLKNLSIVVVEDTTTFKKLNAQRYYYSKVLPLKPEGNLDARTRALNALEEGKMGDSTLVEAFASDAIIVQTLLEKGVEEKNNKPYKNNGFVVFPSTSFPSPSKGQSYLPNLSNEGYAIAVRRSESDKWIRNIDKVLENLKNKGSDLEKARDKIRQFEQGKLPDLPVKPDPVKPDPVKPDPVPWSIIISLIAAITPIIVAVFNPEFVKVIFNKVFVRQASQPKPTDRRVVGNVTDDRTGRHIRGAKVMLKAGDMVPLTEFTDVDGIFEFSFQSTEDRIRIRVDADGYEEYVKLMDIAAAKLILDIRLSKQS